MRRTRPARLTPAGESATTLTERVATLEAKLTAQRQEHDALRREMDRLSSRFVAAQDTRRVAKSVPVSAPAAAAPASPVSAQALSDERQAKLVNAGCTAQQASQIRDDIDHVALDRADLVKITAAANSSSIPVTVRRGDERIIGYVPQGPLGIVSGPGYARPDDLAPTLQPTVHAGLSFHKVDLSNLKNA